MNILVFTAHTRWKPHWETELEIMQRHLDAGDRVVHLHCDGALLACDDNIEHRPSRCRECMGIRRAGIAALSGPVHGRPFLNLTRADRRELLALPKTFTSADELKQLRVGNFDLGWAVLSSIVSLTRNPAPDLTKLGKLPAKFVVAAFCIYRSVQNYLRRHPVDRAYVFNGRLAPCRAAFRACQSLGVSCFLHERGCDVNHYSLYENAMPHEIGYVLAQIRLAWERAAADPHRNEIAQRYFIERSKGVPQTGYSFTRDQQEGLMPRDWDPRKRNLAIFTSSEDEFVSISDEWRHPLYSTQIEGVVRIVESLRDCGDRLHIYLRLHPNLRNVSNDNTRALRSLQSDILTVVPPDDPVSTYALLKASHTVLTFGSTVGLEAVYWGKPSILAGTCFYRGLGGTYNPKSHCELVSMIKADLPPLGNEPALMYGYYFKTFGYPFKFYRPISVVNGEFKGRRIQVPRSRLSLAWERTQDAWRYLQAVVFILRTRQRVTGRWRLR